MTNKINTLAKILVVFAAVGTVLMAGPLSIATLIFFPCFLAVAILLAFGIVDKVIGEGWGIKLLFGFFGGYCVLGILGMAGLELVFLNTSTFHVEKNLTEFTSDSVYIFIGIYIISIATWAFTGYKKSEAELATAIAS